MTINEKYNLQQVINASGKMTVLGVSKVDDNVIEDINYGLKNFFVIDDLFKNTQSYLAQLLNVEGTCITSSASSGIAMAVASFIAKDNPVAAQKVHTLKTDKREVVMLKGQNVNYGGNIETMVNLGGGQVVEAGSSNQSTVDDVKFAINENTLCMIYVVSHHAVQKNQVSYKDYVQISKEFNIPLVVDAAAEEDLHKYYNEGADLVIYSGAKAISGPTSGLVIGKKEYTDNLYVQYKGIGRAMKIGKENILGLTRAVSEYVKLPSTKDEQIRICNIIIDNINQNDSFKTSIVQDLAGREIYRVLIEFKDKEQATKLIKFLTTGDLAIETRNHRANLGLVEFDVRAVNEEEAHTISNKINEFKE